MLVSVWKGRCLAELGSRMIASSPGVEGETWTRSTNAGIARMECAYRAKIDGVTIVKIETLVVSGRGFKRLLQNLSCDYRGSLDCMDELIDADIPIINRR